MLVMNIERTTKENKYFRKVLHTGSNSQLVIMSIPVGGDVGEEIHSSTDQIIFIVDGKGEAILDDENFKIEAHDVVFIPAGTIHNIKNAEDKELKLYSIYSPPEHPDGITHATRDDA